VLLVCLHTYEYHQDFSHGIFSTEERDTQLLLALYAIVDAMMKDEPLDVERHTFSYEIDDTDVLEDCNYERKPLTVLEKIQQFGQRIRNRFVDYNDVDLNDIDLTGAEFDLNDEGSRRASLFVIFDAVALKRLLRVVDDRSSP
jgi:hypothetical protein